MGTPVIDPQQALAVRLRRHQLDGTTRSLDEVALLDYGVQDTGTDGAGWALRIRGVEATDDIWGHLALAWTLRGAPHAYRRGDLEAVATATAPMGSDDAAKRIFDASRPLRAAGIDPLDALRTVAGHLRRIVEQPTVKGDVSGALTTLLDQPYLRECRPCAAIHAYEQPFRLSALQAGLELEPGTSPPVLRAAPGMEPPMFGRSAAQSEPRLDVVRNHLRFYGPTTPRHVAAFLDAPVKVVSAHWPADAVEVQVGEHASSGRGASPSVLEGDLEELTSGAPAEPLVRLLAPHDPFLQLRDRELLVADEGRRKDLWRVLGRPGAALRGTEVVATWRPRTSGRRLTVTIDPWARMTAALRTAIEEQAERLAAHRGLELAGVQDA